VYIKLGFGCVIIVLGWSDAFDLGFGYGLNITDPVYGFTDEHLSIIWFEVGSCDCN
jgi:hypothetical protein